MLEKYGMSQAKTVSTPADLSVKLKKEDRWSENTMQSIRVCISYWLEVCYMLQCQLAQILLKQWELGLQ